MRIQHDDLMIVFFLFRFACVWMCVNSFASQARTDRHQRVKWTVEGWFFITTKKLNNEVIEFLFKYSSRAIGRVFLPLSLRFDLMIVRRSLSSCFRIYFSVIVVVVLSFSYCLHQTLVEGNEEAGQREILSFFSSVFFSLSLTFTFHGKTLL